MPTFARDGRSLAYDIVGDGAVVLAVPGMGDTRAQYRHLVPRLVDAGYRVVTLDPRGHGDSDVGFESYAPDAVAGDVVALVDALGVQRVVLAGNSAGAAAVVAAAATLGERCTGVLLVGPIVRNPQAMPGWLVSAMVSVLGVLLGNGIGGAIWGNYYSGLYRAGTPSDHAEHVARVKKVAAQRGRMRALLSFGMTSKTPCSDRANEVTAPVLAILGELDPDYSDVQAEAGWLREALHAEVEVWDGFGHYPHVEDPERVAARTLDFLQAHA